MTARSGSGSGGSRHHPRRQGHRQQQQRRQPARAVGHTIRTLGALVATAARHGRLDVICAVRVDIGGQMDRIRKFADGATSAAIRRAEALRK